MSYTMDNAWHAARRRLGLLEAEFDEGTRYHLLARGVSNGWACLEVGAGNGSVAEWLSERVGPAGRVTATDLDTRFLEALSRPNLEVSQHDIVADPLPETTFDLIHCRLLLMHLPQVESPEACKSESR